MTADNNPRPSILHLPRGPWLTVLDCLCSHFAQIDRVTWLARMQGGRVLDSQGLPLTPEHPYREGLRVQYFREVPAETPIPFTEQILHCDEHLVVVDKPHWLPVTPSGHYVNETLLARVSQRLNNPQLVPLHRIDRLTAGLVLFSCNPASRAQYQALFANRQMHKRYEALAPALPHLSFPHTRSSRIVRGEPFFLSQETGGDRNSETRIEVIAQHGEYWRYGLYPISGKKHQLRVHMAALGAPLCNDPWYPVVQQHDSDDYSRPLQLLAQALWFNDPLSGEQRRFTSQLTLQP